MNRVLTIFFPFLSQDWADGLVGTPTHSVSPLQIEQASFQMCLFQSNFVNKSLVQYSFKQSGSDKIVISELLQQMREAIAKIQLPDFASDPNKLISDLPIPDVNKFGPPPISPSSNCYGNHKAISLDITDALGLEIQVCTFLAFELNGELSMDNLFNNLEKTVGLDSTTGYTLKGALSTGAKIIVTSIDSTPTIELDPIIVQLYMQSDLDGTASLGLLTATVSGDASLQGEFKIGYCPDCNGAYPLDGYEEIQIGDYPPFYLSRNIGYSLDGELAILSGIKGSDLDNDASIKIQDDNIFDEKAPVV